MENGSFRYHWIINNLRQKKVTAMLLHLRWLNVNFKWNALMIWIEYKIEQGVFCANHSKVGFYTYFFCEFQMNIRWENFKCACTSELTKIKNVGLVSIAKNKWAFFYSLLNQNSSVCLNSFSIFLIYEILWKNCKIIPQYVSILLI